MPLVPGTRLGVYEIAGQIGAGGMGEVYQASDTTLGRAVAIKVLPDEVAQDPDRLARFEREARTLASLNHPNIAIVHGLEKAGGVRALVMELVDGPTLADRIALGPIPLDDALPIARQIAEALEAAHEQGIVHRDLKPANVKVRPDGTVKVLDFGLAKTMDPVSALSPGHSLPPTITTPAMTQIGVILGTAAYMSPEQAKGRAADKRSDIWAFGCVLFEMLAGTRAFEGDDISDTLAAILRGEPSWSALPTSTPHHVVRLLRRCLERDPKKRLQAIGDARLEIDEPATIASGVVVAGPVRQCLPGSSVRCRQRWRQRRWLSEPERGC
jgi:eukaryotic-like serine/threonine-protein kinase